MSRKIEYDPIFIERARTMRKESTPAERAFWRVVSNKKVDGYKFRRQHPIGRYIVDFYCHEIKLVIEIDGESHAFQEEYDQVRTAWLEAQGCKVVRFSNREVTQNLAGVVETILAIIRKVPPP